MAGAGDGAPLATRRVRRGRGRSHGPWVPVRDSENPHGPALLIPSPAWAAFVAGLKGERPAGR
ncbi:DUF397 domain-containing protein [Streptomyces sp. NPDC015125]|uniref:DUF397 domain-containing protein n=1 Tax=Streptomyces sp. NPDC015125 TaxID=3364938 RepID=UPI0036F81B2B